MVGTMRRRLAAATADGIPAAKPLLAAINQAYSKDANYVHAQAWDAAHAALLAIKNADPPSEMRSAMP